ncbi:MAG: DUF3108 domain-containing protein [Hyphomicrobium sp.]
MTYRFGHGAKRTLAALVPAVLILIGSAAGSWAQRAGGQMPASVDAVYRISFTALGNIGNFHFKSTVNGDAYTLAADAKIDTTIFDYRGNMSSNGAVPSRTPRPVDYKFNYKQKTFLKKKKLKALNIAFNDGAVSKVTFTPRDELSGKAVPVTPEQLKSVLDPLSGVMALSLTDITKPCSQKLPIYDGKQRFDLVFTPKGRSGGDHVCGVRLVPISGHKPGEGAASVIKGDIVLIMRPVPKANVVIPFRLTVPTIVGTAELTSERVDITMPDQQRFALR